MKINPQISLMNADFLFHRHSRRIVELIDEGDLGETSMWNLYELNEE